MESSKNTKKRVFIAISQLYNYIAMQNFYSEQMISGAVILAAGKGGRIGCSKWQLKMPNGEYFYEYICNAYTQFGCETVLVVNADDAETISQKLPEGVKLAINNRLDLGRLYSLQCGLKQLSLPKPCFVHNIDNPYVSAELLTTLLNGLIGFDYAIPQLKGKGGHPLLIGSSIFEQVMQSNSQLSDLRQTLNYFKGNRLEFENSSILLNVNTLENYKRFLEETTSA